MSKIKQNALQTFLARPDAEQVQAQLASMYASGLTRKDVEARTGFSYKFQHNLSVHRRLASGKLAPNTQCGACAKALYVVPSKLVHDNFCNKKCIADHLRFSEPIVRICNCCGQEFTVRSHGVRSKSCSYECSVTYRTQAIYHDCETCGTEMGPLHPGSKKRFCNKKCFGKSLEKRVTKTCVQCGVQKEIRPCHDRNEVFSCSRECERIFRTTNLEYKAKRDANISAAIKDKWGNDKVWAKAQRLQLSKRAAQMIKDWGHDKPTSAEAACAAILDAVGVAYETQHQLYSEKYSCVKVYDFYLPKSDTLIEVHGTFWHADPRRYPDGTALTHTQRHNIANDAIKADIATSEVGKRLLVVWEHDLQNDPTLVARLLASLK